jgi:hypothetical protein
MAVKPEYKFKPYTPTKLKMAAQTEDLDKTLKALQSQRDNLDARLRAEGIDPENPKTGLDNRNILEKALNLTPDQGVLMDFFEIINRPVEAVKAGLMSSMNGESFVQGALEGISGETVTPGSEFFSKTFGIEPKTGVGKFLTSVGVDIALDPLTYLPAGFFLKRIGKLTGRTLQKSRTLLTGEALQIAAKYGVTDAAGKAFKNMDEFELFIAGLNKTDADNMFNKLLDAAKDAENSDLFILGKYGEDFTEDAYLKGQKELLNYKKSIRGLQDRVNWIRNTQKKIESLQQQYKNNPAQLEKEIRKLLPKSFNGKISDNVLSELKMLDEISPAVKDLGSDYVAVMTTTSNRLDDVAVLKKLKIGDNEVYIRVMSFDSKVAGGAYGATATVIFSGGRRTFSGTANEAFEQIGDNFFKALDDVFIDGNRTLSDELSDLYATQGKKIKGQNLKINPYKRIDELEAAGKITKETAQKARTAMNNAQKAMMRSKMGPNGIVYLSTPGRTGKGVFAKFDDVADYLDFSKTSIGWEASSAGKATLRYNKAGKISTRQSTFDRVNEALGLVGDEAITKASDPEAIKSAFDAYNKSEAGMAARRQFRFSGKLSADDEIIEQIIKDGKATDLSKILEQNMTTGTRNVRVSLLDYLETKEGYIGDFAKMANKVVKSFKGLFDPYAFLPKETQDVIRRMRGELAVEFQTKSLRLAGLQESFIKRFPQLDPKVISQIIEAGAYIDADGVIRYAARTMDAKDYVRHMLNSIDSGKPFQVRNFASQAAEANFVNALNDLMDGAVGVDDLFSIVEKNGVKALNFTGTAEDLKKMLSYVELDLNPTMLDFGKINLSNDAARVLREWEDIGEAITLKNDIQKLLVQEGGFTNFLFDGKIDDTYLRHILTKDAYEYMTKNTPGVLSKFAKPGSDAFQARRYLGTIDEVNDFLKAYYDVPMDAIDNNFFRSTEDFLTKAFRTVEQGKMMDILLTTRDKFGNQLMRVVPNTRDIRQALGPDDIMIKSFKEEFSTMYKNFSPEAQKGLDDFLAREGFGEGQAIVINRSMYGITKEVEKAFVQLPDWVKTYDKFLNTWKGLTLITPGFHLRNLFGNSFNSYAVGMGLGDQIKYASIGMRELNQYDEYAKIIANGGELTKAQQKIYDRVSDFRGSGLVQSHRGVRDLEQVKEATEAAGKAGNNNLYNKAVRFNFNIAEKMDDTQRYILYRWALDKTGDSMKAIDTVAESLFDYSRLTGFEKEYMKRLFPFYTFMKNNFVFQAKNIFRNPQQYARVGRTYKYYLEDIAGYSPEELPDYVVENMWLPIPMMVTKNDTEGIAFLKANLPVSDFTELVENPFKKGVTSLTTPIKLAIEIGAGRDLFTGQPLQEFPGQTSRMEEGTGFLTSLRDERGNLAIASTPLGQKIMNDIGLRTPLTIGSAALDLFDTLAGYQGAPEGLTDILQRGGVLGTQTLDNIELTTLYQDLQRLRELKNYYEQETGNQLPVLP